MKLPFSACQRLPFGLLLLFLSLLRKILPNSPILFEDKEHEGELAEHT